jgi:hypothetical protein
MAFTLFPSYSTVYYLCIIIENWLVFIAPIADGETIVLAAIADRSIYVLLLICIYVSICGFFYSFCMILEARYFF